MSRFPCPKCGKDQDPRKMKRKFATPGNLILNQKHRKDVGYVGTCPNCKTKYSFNPEYYEQVQREEGKGLKGFLVPKRK